MRWIALVLGIAIAYYASTSSAVAAPALQLPWPSGEQHRIIGGVDQYGNPYGGYSYNCGGHTGSNQYAIDFDFGVGQSVAVVAPGVVVEAVDNNLNNGGRGNYLTVDHGGGFISRYLHLRWKTPTTPTFPPGIAQGATATYGGLAAYSGDTPGLGAHLHFDLKLNGSAYMPESMSGVTGFGLYGFCIGQTSSYWTSVMQFTHYEPFAGNINSDSYGDIGLRDFNNGAFYVQYGDSGSSFSGQTQFDWAPGAHYEPFTADFNAGGCGDIGLRDPNDGRFVIRYGNCSGQFNVNQTTFPWGAGYHYQAFTCNVNGDSYPDIGLRDPTNGVFTFRWGDGSGQFNVAQTQYTWAVGQHYQPFARDFNNDSKCDIGLRDPNNGVFYILFGNGSGWWFGNQIQHEWAPGYHYAAFTMKRYSYVLGNIGLKDPNNGIWYIRFYTGGSSFCCETQYPWAPG